MAVALDDYGVVVGEPEHEVIAVGEGVELEAGLCSVQAETSTAAAVWGA